MLLRERPKISSYLRIVGQRDATVIHNPSFNGVARRTIYKVTDTKAGVKARRREGLETFSFQSVIGADEPDDWVYDQFMTYYTTLIGRGEDVNFIAVSAPTGEDGPDPRLSEALRFFYCSRSKHEECFLARLLRHLRTGGAKASEDRASVTISCECLVFEHDQSIVVFPRQYVTEAAVLRSFCACILRDAASAPSLAIFSVTTTSPCGMHSATSNFNILVIPSVFDGAGSSPGGSPGGPARQADSGTSNASATPSASSALGAPGTPGTELFPKGGSFPPPRDDACPVNQLRLSLSAVDALSAEARDPHARQKGGSRQTLAQYIREQKCSRCYGRFGGVQYLTHSACGRPARHTSASFATAPSSDSNASFARLNQLVTLLHDHSATYPVITDPALLRLKDSFVGRTTTCVLGFVGEAEGHRTATRRVVQCCSRAAFISRKHLWAGASSQAGTVTVRREEYDFLREAAERSIYVAQEIKRLRDELHSFSNASTNDALLLRGRLSNLLEQEAVSRQEKAYLAQRVRLADGRVQSMEHLRTTVAAYSSPSSARGERGPQGQQGQQGQRPALPRASTSLSMHRSPACHDNGVTSEMDTDRNLHPWSDDRAPRASGPAARPGPHAARGRPQDRRSSKGHSEDAETDRSLLGGRVHWSPIAVGSSLDINAESLAGYRRPGDEGESTRRHTCACGAHGAHGMESRRLVLDRAGRAPAEASPSRSDEDVIDESFESYETDSHTSGSPRQLPQ